MPIRKGRMYDNYVFSDHERKNFSILELIRRNGPITRADISKVTDLNIVTVSNYINSYIDKGLVSEGGMEASTGGRKPTIVKLNDDNVHTIGIDLGHMDASGATMIGVVTNLAGKIITKIKKVRTKDTMDKVIEGSLDMIDELSKKKGVDKNKIKGVGIGIGGVIDEHLGTVRLMSANGGSPTRCWSLS